MRPYLPIALLLALSTCGCLFPAAIGTVGAVGSDAPTVWSHWGDGQGERFCLADYGDVIDAAQRAAEVLSLELQEKRIEERWACFRFVDAENDKVELCIRRRSNTMTSIRFDVGWFGSMALGRLLDQQIVAELKGTQTSASADRSN